MYGPNDSEKIFPSIISQIKDNPPFINLTKGEQRRDFIFINDVVRAYKIVLESCDALSNFENFEIGTGKSISIRDLTEKIKNKLDSITRIKIW